MFDRTVTCWTRGGLSINQRINNAPYDTEGMPMEGHPTCKTGVFDLPCGPWKELGPNYYRPGAKFVQLTLQLHGGCGVFEHIEPLPLAAASLAQCSRLSSTRN